MTGTLGVVGTAVVGRIGTSAYFLVKVGQNESLTNTTKADQ